MSEFDLLIAEVANDLNQESVEESCQQTLRDYQCINDLEPGGHPLRMIAWDRG